VWDTAERASNGVQENTVKYCGELIVSEVKWGSQIGLREVKNQERTVMRMNSRWIGSLQKVGLTWYSAWRSIYIGTKL
jgi:hypothetical protein